jgi:Protein of unknown function (DUF1566)/Caspase domain
LPVGPRGQFFPDTNRQFKESIAMPARRWIGFAPIALLLAVGFGTAVICAVSGSARPDTGTNHALIIGIGKYAKWSRLEGPVKDAESISKVLAERYDFKKSNITLLTDKTSDKPTLVNVLTALDGLVRELGEKDNLFVFFSGHSNEDEDGETYWIPADGKKKTKLTWLKHSSLIDEYFGVKNFKAKSLIIVSDSHFSRKLLRKRSISLSPFDLRYTEKIVEKAKRRSREVIAFGDAHWAGSTDTDGSGLFTYYILKALKGNQLEVIDFENLIFDESIYNTIAKIAGTKLIRGRLRSPLAKGGQFVINKLAPAVPVDVLTAKVSPDKGYPGDEFDFEVTTSDPADQVVVEIGGKPYAMRGADTRWQLKAVVDKLGSTSFSVAAINRNGIKGKIRRGKVSTIKKRAEIAHVVSAEVTPGTGMGGDAYTFKATTDKPAAKAALRIGGKTYAMRGSGTAWQLSRKVDQVGRIDFSVIASNEDGVPGKAGQGAMTLTPGIANVATIQTQPETGFAGEEFTIAAKTDRKAHKVNLDIDGQILAMKGKGTTWRIKRKIEAIGKKRFTVTAINVNGDAGAPRSGEILTKKSPVPVPDIIAATVAVVAPGKGYVGDRFAVNVTTTAPSEKVLIDIEGQQFPMTGSGTEWRYDAKIDKLGTSAFTVVARNKEGAQGLARDGIITATKVPAKTVNVVTASVSPTRGEVGKPFRFAARTDIPARGVTLVIGPNRYKMTGSGLDWKLERKIEQSGTIEFKIIAQNADNEPGAPQIASLMAVKARFKKNPDGTLTDVFTGKTTPRFVDNGDDTVTDLLTSLMWTRSPKQIAVEYDEAVEYCRELKVKNHRGWRLPTITEWRRLVDKKQENPALPPGHPFVNIPTHEGYWSKSRHKFGGAYVYQINLWYGKRSHKKKSQPSVVWPVRYAQISE